MHTQSPAGSRPHPSTHSQSSSASNKQEVVLSLFIMLKLLTFLSSCRLQHKSNLHNPTQKNETQCVMNKINIGGLKTKTTRMCEHKRNGAGKDQGEMTTFSSRKSVSLRDFCNITSSIGMPFLVHHREVTATDTHTFVY